MVYCSVKKVEEQEDVQWGKRLGIFDCWLEQWREMDDDEEPQEM